MALSHSWYSSDMHNGNCHVILHCACIFHSHFHPYIHTLATALSYSRYSSGIHDGDCVTTSNSALPLAYFPVICLPYIHTLAAALSHGLHSLWALPSGQDINVVMVSIKSHKKDVGKHPVMLCFAVCQTNPVSSATVHVRIRPW